MNSKTNQHLKELVRQNKIKEVIQLLLKEKSLSESLKNRIILLSSRYSSWKQQHIDGLIDYSYFPAKIVFSLLEMIDVVYEEYNDNIRDTIDIHSLHKFPRFPRVEFSIVSMSLIEEIAIVIPVEQAVDYINEINAFRREADPEDDSVTEIKTNFLPVIGPATPYSFWSAAIKQACLNGPRMLAAFLLTIPDQYFKNDSSIARKRILFEISEEV